MPGLGKNGLAAGFFYRFQDRPHCSGVEDDLVVLPVMLQHDFGQQGGDINARDKAPFVIHEHHAVAIAVPHHPEVGMGFSHQFFRFSLVFRQQRVGRALGEATIRRKVERHQVEVKLPGDDTHRQAGVTEVGVYHYLERFDNGFAGIGQNVFYIICGYFFLLPRSFFSGGRA